MNIEEETFLSWSKGPGKTEAEKCENAETAVRKAIAADEKLSKLNVVVSAQGSYKSRTNIRQDSDVDICICYKEVFFAEYPEGKTSDDFGNKNEGLLFLDYKSMVEKALKSYFGVNSVSRGDKAFDVHANTYRIDADVIPTYENRRYSGNKNSDGSHQYWTGVAFNTDKGAHIINWPKRVYDNGLARNDATERRYKRVIRIFKRLRNQMQEEKISDSENIASFLLECLVWNAPLEAFQHETYIDILRHVIANVCNRTTKDEDCKEWGEVSEFKYLFRSSQPWTRSQANKFLDAAWNYIGYK
jgi:hypothetical protein